MAEKDKNNDEQKDEFYEEIARLLTTKIMRDYKKEKSQYKDKMEEELKDLKDELDSTRISISTIYKRSFDSALASFSDDEDPARARRPAEACGHNEAPRAGRKARWRIRHLLAFARPRRRGPQDRAPQTDDRSGRDDSR